MPTRIGSLWLSVKKRLALNSYRTSPLLVAANLQDNSPPQSTFLDNYPEFFIVDIFFKLLPEELLHLVQGPVSKRFQGLLQGDELWSLKLKQHFPLASCNFAPGGAFALFWQTYKEEYTEPFPFTRETLAKSNTPLLSPMRRELFSLAKEGDIRIIGRLASFVSASDSLWEFSFNENRTDYEYCDKHFLTPLNWLAINKHQTIFDMLYKNEVWPKALNNNQLLWAIICQQPVKEIQLIKEKNSSAFLESVYRYGVISREFPQRAYLYAANFGQVEVIDYLLGVVKEKILPMEEFATTAIACGHLNLNRFFSANLRVLSVLAKACKYGKWEIVKQLDLKPASPSLTYPLPIPSVDQECIESSLWHAAKGDQLEVVKRLCLTNIINANNLIIEKILKAAKRPNQSMAWLKCFRSPYYNTLCEETGIKLKALAEISLSEPLAKARALLNNYTHGNSAVNRFFHGHWNRHYLVEVAQIIAQIDSGELNSKQSLLAALNNVEKKFPGNFNKSGSFARRREFIREIIFAVCEDTRSSLTR